MVLLHLLLPVAFFHIIIAGTMVILLQTEMVFVLEIIL